MDKDDLITFKNLILGTLFTTILLKFEVLIIEGPWWKEALTIFLIWYCLCVVIFLLDNWMIRPNDFNREGGLDGTRKNIRKQNKKVS